MLFHRLHKKKKKSLNLSICALTVWLSFHSSQTLLSNANLIQFRLVFYCIPCHRVSENPRSSFTRMDFSFSVFDTDTHLGAHTPTQVTTGMREGIKITGWEANESITGYMDLQPTKHQSTAPLAKVHLNRDQMYVQPAHQMKCRNLSSLTPAHQYLFSLVMSCLCEFHHYPICWLAFQLSFRCTIIHVGGLPAEMSQKG